MTRHAGGTDPKLGRVRVVWHRYVYFDVVCRTSPLELSFDLDHVLYTGALVVLDLMPVYLQHSCCSRKNGTHGSLDPDQWLHRRAQPVAHQLKLTVWWNERYLRGKRSARPHAC